ncbi:hypothetical protein SUGI_0605620 [Cryptomeria japonica]|nr:hypothetical protein SUGI_0605620 [Cryptomeria japonica]
MAMAAPLERVWEIASDFCGMKKWYPALLVCERVEGTPEQGPGCVRYICSASSSSSSGDGILRAKEKLISMDCINHSYTYSVIDINIEGFQGYQSTFQVTESEEGSCAVKWNFEVEPIPGRSESEFVSKWSSVLTTILNTLQDLASSP